MYDLAIRHPIDWFSVGLERSTITAAVKSKFNTLVELALYPAVAACVLTFHPIRFLAVAGFADTRRMCKRHAAGSG